MTNEEKLNLHFLLAELLEPALNRGIKAKEIHRDLSKRVGRTEETIKNWRTGKSTPKDSLETQLALLKALVDLDYISGPSDVWVEKYLGLFGLPTSPELLQVIRTYEFGDMKIAYSLAVGNQHVPQSTSDEIEDAVDEASADPDLLLWNGQRMWIALLIIGIVTVAVAAIIQLRGREEQTTAGQIVFCDESEEMVFVEAGEFIMGSTDEQIEAFAESCPPDFDDPDCGPHYFTDELPARSVMLPSFCIDQHEVTNAEFREFVLATDYVTSAEKRGMSAIWVNSDRDWREVPGANWRHPNGPNTSINGLDDHPVVQVSLADAVLFCEWRGKRLPTAAEWEKAARGTNGWLRPWGDAWDSHRVNYYGLKPPGTRTVGSFSEGASPYGAMDMLGNVMEWVTVDTGAERRGGSWASIEVYMHAAWRNYASPEDTRPTVGLRCAKDVSTE